MRARVPHARTEATTKHMPSIDRHQKTTPRITHRKRKETKARNNNQGLRGFPSRTSDVRSLAPFESQRARPGAPRLLGVGGPMRRLKRSRRLESIDVGIQRNQTGLSNCERSLDSFDYGALASIWSDRVDLGVALVADGVGLRPTSTSRDED